MTLSSPGLAPLSQVMPQTHEALLDGMRRTLHIGAQLYVAHRGKTVADHALGQASPNTEMTPQTLMLWLSASKPVAAVAVAQLLERSLLELDDPVCVHIPEFAQGGKEAVTIRHILTHTGGFRWLETGWPLTPWEQIIDKICQMPLERNWTPGERAGYDPATSWFILGELVRRLDGRPYEQYVREAIFLPLGCSDSWVGMDESVYRQLQPRLGVMQQTAKLPPSPLEPYDTPAAVVSCRPGANGHGPISELGKFYLALLNGGVGETGQRILRASSVRLLTQRHRVGMYDETFRHKIDWGLGFILNSNVYGIDTVPYGFGALAGVDTFGHNGYQSSSAFADPNNVLVVATVCNGTPGETPHHARMRTLHRAIYLDLGLA